MSRLVASANRTSATLESLRGREDYYREGIKENHELCKTAARRLGPELEKTLLQACSEEEVKKFMNEQTDRLKAVAAMNVQNDRFVSDFCATLSDLRNEVLQEESNEAAFNDRIQQIMNTKQAQSAARDVKDEKEYKEILGDLGEAQDYDDDDVIVQQSSTTQNLKCPILMCLMEDAVRSKTCKHTYSRAGISDMIRKGRGKCTCPIAGCSNKNVTQKDIEVDAQVVRAVKREKMRESQRQASQFTQTVDSDDE